MKAARAILSLLALAWCGPALADATTLETAYLAAAEHVHKHTSDLWLDDKPQSAHILNHAWELLAAWTAAYLNAHPDATPKGLKRAAPVSDLDAISLGPRTMLVSAAVDNGFGTFFIVDGTNGAFRPVWSIRARAGRGTFPVLDAWTDRGATDSCRKTVSDADELRCGPLGGGAKRLSDDAQGHPRFYIQASYLELAGNTEAEQLSFWTWKDGKAEPQFVTTFGTNIDDETTRLDGDLLKVRLAEEYRMISPWWDHLERELDWTFRVESDRIEDLGKKPLAPAVDAVDEALFRVARHLPADDVATPQVQAKLERIVSEARNAHARYGETGDPSLGMDGSPIVRQGDGESLVCLPTTEQGLLIFKLTGAFVSKLSVNPDGSTNDCPSGKP